MVPGIATEDFSTPPSSPMTHSASNDAWGGVTESSFGDPVSADSEIDFNHSDLDKTGIKLCKYVPCSVYCVNPSICTLALVMISGIQYIL